MTPFTKPMPKSHAVQNELTAPYLSPEQRARDILDKMREAFENFLLATDKSWNNEWRSHMVKTSFDAGYQDATAQQNESIVFWRQDSAQAWDTCEERRLENVQQNERIKDLEAQIEHQRAMLTSRSY